MSQHQIDQGQPGTFIDAGRNLYTRFASDDPQRGRGPLDVDTAPRVAEPTIEIVRLFEQAEQEGFTLELSGLQLRIRSLTEAARARGMSPVLDRMVREHRGPLIHYLRYLP
jgi:hypothetical protein